MSPSDEVNLTLAEAVGFIWRVLPNGWLMPCPPDLVGYPALDLPQAEEQQVASRKPGVDMRFIPQYTQSLDKLAGAYRVLSQRTPQGFSVYVKRRLEVLQGRIFESPLDVFLCEPHELAGAMADVISGRHVSQAEKNQVVTEFTGVGVNYFSHPVAAWLVAVNMHAHPYLGPRFQRALVKATGVTEHRKDLRHLTAVELGEVLYQTIVALPSDIQNGANFPMTDPEAS